MDTLLNESAGMTDEEGANDWEHKEARDDPMEDEKDIAEDESDENVACCEEKESGVRVSGCVKDELERGCECACCATKITFFGESRTGDVVLR